MKKAWIATVTLSFLLSAVGVGTAQDTAAVRVEGRVLWRAGQALVLGPDGSPSVTVDLASVPLDQQQGLREGDRVVVSGAVTNARNRIVALPIDRLTS